MTKKLSEKTRNALKKKADGSKFTLGELTRVYKRGIAAGLGNGSRRVPLPAWAMGRVNSYMRNDKARKADKDIYQSARKRGKN